MAHMKSFNSKEVTHVRGILHVMRTVITSIITVTAVLVMVGIAVGLTGCSSKGKSQNTSANSSQTTHDPVVASVPQTATTEEAVTKKVKSVVKRPSTLTYSSSSYGVSFRFPREYQLTTPGGDMDKSTLVGEVPRNFVQPGGETIATIELPANSATSFFSVSASKGLTSNECAQFALPEPSDPAGNSPVDESDGSIPSKTSIHGVQFSKVENASELEDVKYYHHFEPSADGVGGTCYEFAMGVEQWRVSSSTLDYSELFGKLERVMATVKMKSQEAPTVTATVPGHDGSGTSPQ